MVDPILSTPANRANGDSYAEGKLASSLSVWEQLLMRNVNSMVRKNGTSFITLDFLEFFMPPLFIVLTPKPHYSKCLEIFFIK